MSQQQFNAGQNRGQAQVRLNLSYIIVINFKPYYQINVLPNPKCVDVYIWF